MSNGELACWLICWRLLPDTGVKNPGTSDEHHFQSIIGETGLNLGFLVVSFSKSMWLSKANGLYLIFSKTFYFKNKQNKKSQTLKKQTPNWKSHWKLTPFNICPFFIISSFCLVQENFSLQNSCILSDFSVALSGWQVAPLFPLSMIERAVFLINSAVSESESYCL